MTSGSTGRPRRGASRACKALAVGLLWAAGAAGALAQNAGGDAIDNLSDRLIDLRADVERLNDELATAKEKHRNRMAALARQRGQLEAALVQASTQLTEISGQLVAAREDAQAAGADAEALMPVVLAVIEEAEQAVATSIPFKREQRLAELEELRTRLRQDVITPHKAVNSLWAFYEDQLRLTGDNGLYQQTVRIDGQEQLADVARLGMVMMYYRTGDEHYGKVLRADGEWQYRPVAAQRRDLVADLFESFRRQVRTGYFKLPNAIGQARVRQALGSAQDANPTAKKAQPQANLSRAALAAKPSNADGSQP